MTRGERIMPDVAARVAASQSGMNAMILWCLFFAYEGWLETRSRSRWRVGIGRVNKEAFALDRFPPSGCKSLPFPPFVFLQK